MTTAATKPTQQQLQPPKAPSKMVLASIVRGKQQRPYRLTGYGPEGIGKTTFGAEAPSPIFLATEDGTFHLDVARFPKPETLADVFDAIRELATTEHKFQTLVIDTLDHLEPIIWKYICERDSKSNVEDYGYGKGYVAALDEWRKVLAALERLQAAKGMNIVLLAHSQSKTFKNPVAGQEDFDRYQLKLNDKAAGLIKEWSDDVLFMKYEEYSKKDDKTKRVRGVSTGARLIHTERTAAWDAKNRHGLPPELPLSWPDFHAAATAGKVADPKDLRAEIERKAKELGPDVEKKVQETLAKAGDDAQSLAVINNRLNARLAEKEQVQ